VSGPAPSLDDLRRQAAALRIDAADEDLEGVRAFLDVILPALEEIERTLPADAPPTGVPLV
jgi:hypothetical protein